MAVLSAGLLVHRGNPGGSRSVLLAHPGGPFWARKDLGAWSIPKGEYVPDEDPLAAAHREFREEVGLAPPPGPELALGERRQPSGKRLTVWAIEGDLDLTGLTTLSDEAAKVLRANPKVNLPSRFER